MCIKNNQVGNLDIWSQASYWYPISWEAFVDPSDSYFLFADFVDFYTHWTYMLIFCRIFLSNYWWQKSNICSMCIKINKVGKQEVGIWWVHKRFPRYGVPIWSLWPNIKICVINSCWEKCDEKCAYMFNVYKNQLSRQIGSRNLTDPKMLPTIWHTYMKLVTVKIFCFYTSAPQRGRGGVYCFTSVHLSFHPSKIFFIAFFSATINGRNLIFGHKLHIGMPYCG
jgi:hypothetical protein